MLVRFWAGSSAARLSRGREEGVQVRQRNLGWQITARRDHMISKCRRRAQQLRGLFGHHDWAGLAEYSGWIQVATYDHILIHLAQSGGQFHRRPEVQDPRPGFQNGREMHHSGGTIVQDK